MTIHASGGCAKGKRACGVTGGAVDGAFWSRPLPQRHTHSTPARSSTGANTVEGGTVGDAAAQPTVPTGTDFSLGVSLSFCGGSVRKETSVGCAPGQPEAKVATGGRCGYSHSARHKADIGVICFCDACVCIIF